MKGFLRTCTIAAIGVFMGTVAHAAPILTVTNGSVLATVTVTAAPPVFTVAGLALGSVDEATTAEHLGTGVIDASAGTTHATLSSPATAGEAIDLVFLLSPGLSDAEWLVNVSGTPLTGISDLALIGFAGADIAHFALVSSQPFIVDGTQVGTQFVYNLTTLNGTGAPVGSGQAAIPEPASLCLVGSGLLMALRRRRANKA
jgi:hypothetical protein